MKLKSLLKESVQKQIQSKLKELGLGKIAGKVPSTIQRQKIGAFWELEKLGTVKLNPKTFGPMSLLFTTADVFVSVGEDDDGDAHIWLQFSWEHPSGSNGSYKMQIRQYKGKWQAPER
jgi:hypothetical protein